MMFSALLPMKGHSERVPGKNLRDCGGKPLCQHVLETLISVDQITEVLVDTDSEDIASFCSNFDKVRIVERPKELCGDFVSMNKVIAYDLTFAKNDFIIQTHATNPLLEATSIISGLNTFQNKECDSVFSVNQYHARFYDESLKAINHNPDELLRTQDLPPIYEENSNFYVFSKDSFFKSGNQRIGLQPEIAVTDKIESLDIDEEVDFKLAEIIIKSR